MTDKVYHKNKGIPVEKKLPSGELVHTYDNMKQAQRGEKIGYTSLKTAIDNQVPVNGHLFSLVQPIVARPKTKKPKPGKRPRWAGKNGMFDIDAWGKMTFFV